MRAKGLPNGYMGIEFSIVAKEHGFVDFKSLAEMVGNKVLNNYVYELTNGSERLSEWEWYCGEMYNDEGYPYEVSQYYIITENGAKFLKKYTDEIVMYNYDLDMYLWGITNFGTAWDYVLTDIPIISMEEFLNNFKKV